MIFLTFTFPLSPPLFLYPIFSSHVTGSRLHEKNAKLSHKIAPIFTPSIPPSHTCFNLVFASEVAASVVARVTAACCSNRARSVVRSSCVNMNYLIVLCKDYWRRLANVKKYKSKRDWVTIGWRDGQLRERESKERRERERKREKATSDLASRSCCNSICVLVQFSPAAAWSSLFSSTSSRCTPARWLRAVLSHCRSCSQWFFLLMFVIKFVWMQRDFTRLLYLLRLSTQVVLPCDLLHVPITQQR